MATHSRFSAIFTLGGNFSDFLFAFPVLDHQSPSEKRPTLKEKYLIPLGVGRRHPTEPLRPV